MPFFADINETDIFNHYPNVLKQLLVDQTTNHNIFWATDSYENMGEGFQYNDAITIEKITGEFEKTIRPRSFKSREEKAGRTKDMAEVFTPSWVCNSQNNLIDNSWFGKENVFNIEDPKSNTWKSTTEKISFPEGKTWQDYVCSTRMEITCGEGPYLASRYDTTTGQYIPIKERIGIIDRKLRIVSENTFTSTEWLEMAHKAYKNVYAFEWQGDNLLLAREALLVSFIEYYYEKFGKNPHPNSILSIAEIISWNIWQMDGLRGVVPNSCKNGIKKIEDDMFDGVEIIDNCKGCKSGKYKEHNGAYCIIREWVGQTYKKYKTIKFIDIIK